MYYNNWRFTKFCFILIYKKVFHQPNCFLFKILWNLIVPLSSSSLFFLIHHSQFHYHSFCSSLWQVMFKPWSFLLRERFIYMHSFPLSMYFIILKRTYCKLYGYKRHSCFLFNKTKKQIGIHNYSMKVMWFIHLTSTYLLHFPPRIEWKPR